MKPMPSKKSARPAKSVSRPQAKSPKAAASAIKSIKNVKKAPAATSRPVSRNAASSAPVVRGGSTDRFVIIMAGGRGERFWPVSREKTPKQLIRLLGERSFLQQAVDRVRPLVPLTNILIITNAVQAAEVRRQLPELPKENVIGEPVGRDTCAAVALGAAVVGARSTTAVMAVLPADHVIHDEKGFRQVLSDALDVAARGQVIVTIGIQPTGPETGYGYIHSFRECLTGTRSGQGTQDPFLQGRAVRGKTFPGKGSGIPRLGALPMECRNVRMVVCDPHQRVVRASAGDAPSLSALVCRSHPGA